MTATEIVVVGGSVAGLQAALVLGRSRRGVTVVDVGEARNARAHEVHNLAGQEGISPGELLSRARSDAQRYGVRIVPGKVTGARVTDGGRWLVDIDADIEANSDVETDAGARTGADVLSARALVLATGIVEDLPAVDGMAELWGGDVVSCPYCHGWEATGRPVAVVGNGARAWQQLLLLGRFTENLTLVADGPAAMDGQQTDQLLRLGVTVREDPVSRVVADQGRLVGIEFRNGQLLPYAVLFAATTRSPGSTLAAEIGCTLSGAGVVADAQGRTGVPGVWAVGTCAEPGLTVAGAMGHATTTAIALNNALIDEDLAVQAPAAGA